MADATDRQSRFEAARRERNAELAGRVKRGEPISATIDPQLVLYPPRPLIKKDAKEMARIFGDGEAKRG